MPLENEDENRNEFKNGVAENSALSEVVCDEVRSLATDWKYYTYDEVIAIYGNSRDPRNQEDFEITDQVNTQNKKLWKECTYKRHIIEIGKNFLNDLRSPNTFIELYY